MYIECCSIYLAFYLLCFVLSVQYTQQKAHVHDTNTSVGWSFGVLESVKAQWNRAVVTVTSALVNENRQWDRTASWTSAQAEKVTKYFKSPPTGQ